MIAVVGLRFSVFFVRISVFLDKNSLLPNRHPKSKPNKYTKWRLSTYPSLTFPIDEKSIFVHFECARQFEICIIFFLCPSIEYAAGQQLFGHRYLPIEFKLFRHSFRLFMISASLRPNRITNHDADGCFRSFLLFRIERDRFRTKCNSSEIRKTERMENNNQLLDSIAIKSQ